MKDLMKHKFTRVQAKKQHEKRATNKKCGVLGSSMNKHNFAVLFFPHVAYFLPSVFVRIQNSDHPWLHRADPWAPRRVELSPWQSPEGIGAGWVVHPGLKGSNEKTHQKKQQVERAIKLGSFVNLALAVSC